MVRVTSQSYRRLNLQIWIFQSPSTSTSCFGELGEFCSEVLLWSSRNILQNTKLLLTFHQHEGELIITDSRSFVILVFLDLWLLSQSLVHDVSLITQLHYQIKIDPKTNKVLMILTKRCREKTSVPRVLSKLRLVHRVWRLVMLLEMSQNGGQTISRRSRHFWD